jgi:predicted PurR-regulated permease PerM
MEQAKYHPALNMLLLALILLGLYLGKELLIPFVLGLVVWYLIYSIRLQVGKIRVGDKSLPKAVQSILSLSIVLSFFWFIGRMVVSNLKEFALVAPEYNVRINSLSAELAEKINIPSVHELTDRIDLPTIVGDILNSSLSFLSGLFIVLFYVIFLMLEQDIFMKKLNMVFKSKEQKLSFFKIISKIDKSVHSYLSVKTLIALATAVISYIVFLSFGLDFAILWAFLVLLLNFIPFVGAFIAILFPTIISILQFGDMVTTVALLAILSGIQVVIGNFLEPKLVGKSLNLSPLVVILALAFWGSLWGVAGMFLCVPITVTLMIVLNQFPNTKGIAALLSAGNDPEN